MATLAERMRAAREQWVTVDGFELQIRRPTDMELVRWAKDQNEVFLAKTVVGWKFKEHELVPGGGGDVPAFDIEAFIDWIGDHPEVANRLVTKVIELYNKSVEARKAQQKNS